MKKLITIFLIAIIIGLVSCIKEENDEKIKVDPGFASELKSTPENITIGNNTYFLTTYLWRDFMPVAEENGSPMICIDYLTEKDSLSIPSTVELKKQYVVKGNEIWTAYYSEISNDINFIVEGIVRDGPKWGPNISVDVVCEFEISGTTYRVLAKSQNINRTD